MRRELLCVATIVLALSGCLSEPASKDGTADAIELHLRDFQNCDEQLPPELNLNCGESVKTIEGTTQNLDETWWCFSSAAAHSGRVTWLTNDTSVVAEIESYMLPPNGNFLGEVKIMNGSTTRWLVIEAESNPIRFLLPSDVPSTAEASVKIWELGVTGNVSGFVSSNLRALPFSLNDSGMYFMRVIDIGVVSYYFNNGILHYFNGQLQTKPVPRSFSGTDFNANFEVFSGVDMLTSFHRFERDPVQELTNYEPPQCP